VAASVVTLTHTAFCATFYYRLDFLCLWQHVVVIHYTALAD